METFKRRAIEILKKDCNQSVGIIQATIYACIRTLEGIPDDEHSGEKTCGPDYEAECEVLRAKLEELTAEKNEAELMVQEAYQQIRSLRETVERLEGFREGVIMGINARNRVQAARALRNCYNRMEDSYE